MKSYRSWSFALALALGLLAPAAWYFVNRSASLVLAGLCVTLLVYSALRAKARESNDRLQAVIEAAPLAIIARDLETRITMWNPAAERMFGRTQKEVLGTETSIVPEHLIDETRRVREAAVRGETSWIEETQRKH